MTDHPITPPPELVRKWIDEATSQTYAERWIFIVEQAAQWGYEQRGEVNDAKLQQSRDQELEGCIEVIESGRWFHNPVHRIAELRAARRPKPPSLKRVALLQLDTLNADLGLGSKGVDLSQIRRALEQLPND